MKNDERIISALLECATVKDAAMLVGISERTIYNRLSNQAFTEMLAAERRRLFKATSTSMQAQIGKSIQTMVDIRDNKAVPPQVRLNASAEIVRNGLKMIELIDVSERMDTIEEMLEAIK